MELIWLEDFVALAETGNFSRAAENRHVTQPAFSRRVRALEDWVGAPLFDRATPGVTLTAAGQQFRTGADELIRRINQLRRESREAGGMEAATLRFAATHALSFTFFPQWMRELESRATLGPIRLISDSMQACEDLMLHGEAQFLLCHHHAAAPSRFGAQFRSQVVGQDALAPFVAPGPDGGPRWSLSDGADEIPYLAYSDESGLGRIIEAQRFTDRAQGLKVVFSARLAASLMTMARDGRGVAWLPVSLAENEVAQGRLVRAAGGDWEAPVDIRVFRPTARQSLAAEAFWSELAVR
ncbi:LysR family transcriptional regulator [Caulobacter sp. Root655]|uniref:LysR family transcriptional regulator n=1 Tax=Caulobacter sp. Root655 TaxID=1736578 RepID=UPI0006F44F0C|nr:LysR family transcriptional regulator [Caulobacter sp. Root655]KRA59250.1 LysR family transcriptional regulator [Caulobacter sp. Root655]